MQNDLTADDCDRLAKTYGRIAARFLERAHEPLACAADAEGVAKGFAFRAEELRYDARGGMTEELARRRFEPGARWALGSVELVIGRPNIFGLPLVHFRDVAQPVERAELTRANGWLFLGLSDQGGYR